MSNTTVEGKINQDTSLFEEGKNKVHKANILGSINFELNEKMKTSSQNFTFEESNQDDQDISQSKFLILKN